MKREFYLSLAERGLRMPIGTDLVLHEHGKVEEILVDGERLGRVVEESARRWKTPLAIPLMDLRLEKADLLRTLGVAPGEVDSFHFQTPPSLEQAAAVEASPLSGFGERNQAHIDAVRYVAQKTDLVAVGMAIGPFSLMTKLVKDPITAVALAGGGVTGEEDESVLAVERCLEMAERAVHRSVLAQVEAGAKAILICEPAANRVYLSPKQMRLRPALLEHFVLAPNLRLRNVLERHGADLIFHDCGELTTAMVRAFAHGLHPVILSLGGSRNLWDDAAHVPGDVVLFGNLPTKTFYSDAAMPDTEVARLARELMLNMRACAHAHILGSECDVLHVPEAAGAIRRKVDLMLTLEVN